MSSRAVASDRPAATARPGCPHERAHIVDSRFYGDFYSTEASRRIFCDVCRYQRWLDVEAALALSQAELGLVPSEQAELITAAARVELLDLDWVGEEIRRTRHSLVRPDVPLQREARDADPQDRQPEPQHQRLRLAGHAGRGSGNARRRER